MTWETSTQSPGPLHPMGNLEENTASWLQLTVIRMKQLGLQKII